MPGLSLLSRANSHEADVGESPLLAQSGHQNSLSQCPLLGKADMAQTKRDVRLPPPWSVEDNGACDIDRDHGRKSLLMFIAECPNAGTRAP
jgi:hypothetical protein